MDQLRPLALFALLLGCGGSSRSTNLRPTCGQVQPCGGDVVGDWTIGASCQMGLHFDFSFCPNPTIDPSGLATTGTFSLTADFMYTAATNAAGSFDIDFPASCVPSGMTCADLTATVQGMVAPNLGPGLQSVSCAGTTACVCTVFPIPSVTNESGTYTVSGNAITTTAASGTSITTFDYCVQGNTLHLVTLDPSMAGPGGQPAVVYDVVAERP
jgi:hypothetical protein